MSVDTRARKGQEYSLQNDFRIRAALSDSWSSVVGQNASDPILFVSLFTGTPSFSNPVHALSKAALLPCFVLSQADMLLLPIESLKGKLIE